MKRVGWIAAAACAAVLFAMGSCREPEEEPPDDIISEWAPAPVVVLVAVDTLARHTMEGWQSAHATHPNLSAFFAESTHFRDVLAVRGITSPAVASTLTGVYPHSHGVRRNTGWPLPIQPTLMERFDEAGYHVIGAASNTCQFIDRGVDVRVCTWSHENEGVYENHAVRDRELVDQFWVELDQRPADEPLFVWMHLMNPHVPYTLIEPYYSEFHPEEYTGEIDASAGLQLDAAILGQIPFDEEDLAHVRAVYMSQVRDTDDLFGELMAGLADRGLLEDSVVMFGVDHGESLGERSDYLYHGCSPYNDVLAVTFAVRAPDRLPAGLALDGWVSQVDMGPTLIQTAGLDWSGDREGRSLVDDVLAGAVTEHDLFFERDVETAGIVRGQTKYIRDEDEGNDSCPPYSRHNKYPGELDELYDMAADPEEAVNLAASQPALQAELLADLCAFVNEGYWYAGALVDTTRLGTTCAQFAD